MKAGLRLGVLVAAAGLGLGAPAVAQTVPDAATNTPSTDAIGPRELQDFSLSGTVTREADQPPPTRAAPPAQRPPAVARQTPSPRETQDASAPANRSSAPATQPQASALRSAAAESVSTAPAPEAAPSLSSLTVKLPPATASAQGTTAAAAPAFADEADAAPALTPDRDLPVWPWLLAAMALGAGGAFLFFRNRARAAYAGGPQIDAFVAPEPPVRPRTPSPRPQPAPPASAPASPGIVSARLRPWLDLSFNPLRCIVEEERVRFEFELSLFNSGSAAARDVLIEAVMINASADQDQELGAFFGRQSGEGEKIAQIPPLQRMTLRPQVIIPLAQVRVLEAAGRRVFVPLLAFNAHYGWSGGAGQSSAAYLLGRDTKSEKMAPFRLDLGPRVFRAVAALALPTAIRR